MRKEFRVGLFFIVGIVILFLILEFVGEIPFFTSQHRIITYFDNIAELKEGNPVKLEGVEVGKIDEIKLEKGKIKIFMQVRKDAPIKKDSVASIKLTSLLGTSYLNVSFGSEESDPVSSGDVIASEPPADLNQLLAKLESAVGSVDSALGAFDVLGENKESFNRIVTNLDVVTSDLAEGKGTLGKLLKDESLYNELNGTFAGINDLTDSIKQGKGTFGKLMTDESLYNETKDAMKNLSNVSNKLANSQGTIGKLINDDELYDEATEAAKNLNSILRKVNSGKGTLGKLVNDDSLYHDTKNTVLKVEKGVDTVEDLAPLGTLGAVLGVMTFF